MNEMCPLFIIEHDGNKNKEKWSSMIGIRVNLHHEKSVTCKLSKLNHSLRFDVLNLSGNLVNNF